MATSRSRETARKALAALLEAALVGSGKPAQAVYAYQVGDFAGASPVVVVSSGGSLREQGSFGPCWDDTFSLAIYSFVLYANPDDGWTESDAEDALDDIEATIADVILENMTSDVWSNLSYEDRTETDGVEIGGHEYRRETVRVTVRAK